MEAGRVALASISCLLLIDYSHLDELADASSV